MVARRRSARRGRLGSTSNKFYAVKRGRDGPYMIYDNWPQCSLAVKGLKGVQFKSFVTRAEAENFLGCRREKIVHAEHKMAPLKVPPTEVFTDGGCRDNGTPHAIAGVGVYYGEAFPPLSLPLPGLTQTNNRAELLGLLLGILGTDRNTETVVRSDSKYAMRAVTEWVPQWLGDNNNDSEPEQLFARTENWDLIHLVYTALQDRPKVRLEYVQAHVGIAGNERADELATEAINRTLKRQRVLI